MVVAAGLTLTAVPLVAARLPGVMTPVPLEKTPVRFVLVPAVIDKEPAAKLEMTGAGLTGVPPPPEEPPQPVKLALRTTHEARATTNRLIIFTIPRQLDDNFCDLLQLL